MASLQRRRGFTLIELLVCVAIVSLLAALALVALSRARESTRRTQCANQVRQIGLALQSYHAALQSLPAAVIWSPAGEPLGEGLYPIGVIDRVARFGDAQRDTIFANWLIQMLPQLEQTALAAQFNPRVPIAHPQNEAVRRHVVATLVCPSDPWSDATNQFERGAAARLSGNWYARGNYAINVGPSGNCVSGHAMDGEPCVAGFSADTADLRTKNRQVWGSGVAGVNKSFRLSDIVDGLSHTVAVDEIRAGLDPLDPRGVWALGQVGSSLIARHGKLDDAGQPNHQHGSGEVFIGCTALTEKLGEAELSRERMACYNVGLEREFNAQCGSRSCHPGGVNVLLCDGSARFVPDEIDTEVWHAIHTRNGSEPADF